MTTTEATDIPQNIARPWLTPMLRFWALVLLLCAVQFDVLRSMVDIWYNTTTYNHGFLVFPATLWMIWRRREEVAALANAAGIIMTAPAALLPLAGFATIGLLGELGGANILRHVGFVGALMCLFPLALGWEFAKRFAFPILFLAFMVPAGDFLIPVLQDLTADVSVWMIQMTGVPVYREGIMIELPSGLWEVAEACAGIRFLIANIFIAAMFAYFSYEKMWKWALFMVLAVAIPVIANCFRAYGIMMLAHVTDNALAVGVDHLVYGWVFFSAVMLLMLWVGGKFSDRVIADPVAKPVVPRAGVPSKGGAGVILAGALVMSGAPAFAALTEPVAEPLPAIILADVVPQGWNVVAVDGEAADHWTPKFATADQIESVRLRKGAHVVDVYVAAYSHQREGAEALHWANRFDDDETWKRSKLATIRLATGASALPDVARLDELTHYVMGDGLGGTDFTSRVVISWTQVGGDFTADAKAAKLSAVRARVTGGTAKAAVFALSAQYVQPDQRDAAVAAVEALLADMTPLSGLLDVEGRPSPAMTTSTGTS